MSTRANIHLTKGDKQLIFYKHSDGVPEVVGHDLTQMLESVDFDFEIIHDCLLMMNGEYELTDRDADDSEFLYEIDCVNRTLVGYDLYNNNTRVFDYQFDEKDIDESLCAGEHMWKPYFSVDKQNPATLTDEQVQRGEKLYAAICNFMETHPDEHMAPTLCITQDWDISLDFGGWRSDSDFVNSVVCVMCKDDIGFYADHDYVLQCVPFIEASLKEAAEWCIEEYGTVPDHKEQEADRNLNIGCKIVDLMHQVIETDCVTDTLLEIDTITHEVYLVPTIGDHEDYGGIIRFVSPKELLSTSPNGEFELNIEKIDKLIDEINHPNW